MEEAKHDVPLLRTGDIDTDTDGSPSVPVPISTALTVTIDRDFAIPLVLAIGLAICLVMFTIETFQHPALASMTTVIVPAIATPICALLVNLLRCKKCREREKNENGS